jgi:hypothetical protein
MLKRVLFAALLSMSLAVPTFALAAEGPQAAATPAATQNQAKSKSAHKNRKAKSTGHQGRKGTRGGRRQGMKRSSKSVQQAR